MRRRRFLALLGGFCAAAGLSGCASQQKTVPQTPLPTTAGEIALPPPRMQGEASLEETLQKRRSIRQYRGRALSQEELGQLCWAAQGITVSWGGRTAPSAGALYPLETYLVTPTGCYRYLPEGHKLALVHSDDRRVALWEAGLRQDWIREAAAVFVIAATYIRTARKYGDRAERYVLLEAGHAAQNLLLQAVALGLGGVPVGAFYDERVQAALDLPADYAPLYLIPVGAPR